MCFKCFNKDSKRVRPSQNVLKHLSHFQKNLIPYQQIVGMFQPYFKAFNSFACVLNVSTKIQSV
jgi:hypothetical protein